MLVNCGECGKQISSEASRCVHCGYEYDDNSIVTPAPTHSGANDYVVAIILSPIIGASWAVVALIIAGISGNWNDAKEFAILGGVLGWIVQLFLLWPKNKDR